VVAAEFVDFTHDRLQRRLVRVRPVLSPGWQFAARQQLLEGNPPARDPALDGADCAATDLGCLLVSKAPRPDQDQRLALRLRQVHQRALHVAKLDVAVLARRRGEDFRRGNIVPLALEAGPPHLAEEQVAQDDEGPGPHVGAGLKPLPGGPGLQQRFLNEVVRSFIRKLPIAGDLADRLSLGDLDFIRGSAPLVQGQGSVTIATDDLSFAKSISSSLATTVVPTSLVQSLADSAAALPARRRVSPAGIEFIKSWDTFRAKLHNDENRNCASPNWSPESFINGFVLALEGLTLFG